MKIISKHYPYVFLLALLMISLNVNTKERVNVVAISVADLGNPFFVEIVRSAKKRAVEKFGDNVKVIVKSNAYDLGRQKKQMQDFVDANIIIVVSPDASAVEPAIRSAQKQGAKVIAVDVRANGADATITTDNVQAGIIACEHLAKRLNYQGNVVIVKGPPVSSTIEREFGCLSVIQRYEQLNVLTTELAEKLTGSGNFEGGVDAMVSYLEFHDRIDGVFATNDPMASGVEAAIVESGREGILIISVDGSPLALNKIRNDNPFWIATSAQSPRKMAVDAIDIGYELLQGKKLTNKVRLIPAVLITKHNVHDFDDWSY